MKVVREVKQSTREFVCTVISNGRLPTVTGITVYHMETRNFITVDCTSSELHAARHLAETTLLEYIK